MRKTWLTLVLVGLLVLPLLAQRPGVGRRGAGGGDLLTNKSVQDELKLDEKQKKQLAVIAAKQKESREKMMELFKEKEFEKAMEAGKKAAEETAKLVVKVRESLTTPQRKRLTQIEIQQATKVKNPRIFSDKDVQAVLKLSDKQKETVKEGLSDLDKDIKEVMDDAGKDRKKKQAAFKKAQTLRTEVYEKITKGLTKEQAKAWETAGGEKFELKFENPFGPGKRKNKKDKDDL